MSTAGQRNSAQTNTHLFNTTISREEATNLAAQEGVQLLLPGDDSYNAECSSYNLNHVLEPALVVVATSAADVQAAIRFATQREIPVLPVSLL